MRRSVLALLFAAVAGDVLAQADTLARPTADSLLARARLLAQEGRDADARRIVDSLLVTLTPDSARYADALYARASYATTAADAERDYRRLLIEAPLSPRAEDAMLQLAQLEQARGDRRSASDHLQRFLLSYPSSPARPRVSVQLVRLLFDQGPQQLARACEALRNARSEVPGSMVELRNQLDAQVPRCAYVEAPPPPTPAAVPADSVAPVTAAPPIAAPDSTKPPAQAAAAAAAAPGSTPVVAPPTAAPQAPPRADSGSAEPAAFYSAQVGAFESPEAATRMVQQLAAQRLDARVDGTSAPYRVRVGRYRTRADAVKAVADLKAMGFANAFVAIVSARP